MSDSDYINIIEKAVDLSDGTKSEYIRSLKKLLKDFDNSYVHISNIISQPEKFIECIEEGRTESTVYSILKAITALFKYSDMKDTHKEIHLKWKSYLHPYIQRSRDKWDNNIQSNRTKQCEITWPMINQISRTNPYSLEHVTIALYTIIPPRRQYDYWKLFIIRNDDDKRIMEKQKDTLTGYIDLTIAPCILTILRYKTYKTYKNWTKVLPEPLDKIIRNYLKNNPNFTI